MYLTSCSPFVPSWFCCEGFFIGFRILDFKWFRDVPHCLWVTIIADHTCLYNWFSLFTRDKNLYMLTWSSCMYFDFHLLFLDWYLCESFMMVMLGILMTIQELLNQCCDTFLIPPVSVEDLKSWWLFINALPWIASLNLKDLVESITIPILELCTKGYENGRCRFLFIAKTCCNSGLPGVFGLHYVLPGLSQDLRACGKCDHIEVGSWTPGFVKLSS